MKTALIFTLILSPSILFAAPGNGQLISALKKADEAGNHLAARITLKRLAAAKPTYAEWAYARSILTRKPIIGFDLLFKWDRIAFTDNRDAKTQGNEQKVNGWIDVSDDLMTKGRFQTAFGYYQYIARYLKKEIVSKNRENNLLYLTTVHSMARALYGAGRFKESLEVYDWLPKNYPRYRQVLFEKMWAAFRASRADVAMGAIASQQSAYFSDFMEPESYLVQLYIYKKICRADKQKQVRNTVLQFKKKLQSGQYTYADWAKSDIETYSLLKLTNAPATTQDEIKERESIKNALISRFEKEKIRLLSQLEQVVAYSYLAVAVDTLQLKKNELNRSVLRRGGSEFWPVDDAEDWVDEIGGHIFIGKSQCTAKK